MKRKDDFARMYEENITRVYRYTLARFNNIEKAEDITSKTMEIAYEKFMKSEIKIENESAWLIQISRNVMGNLIQKKKYTVPRDPDIEFEDKSLPFEDVIVSEQQFKFVKKHFDTLDDDTREIITLRIWEEYKFKEISKLVGQNEATVKSIYYRGMDKIKNQMSIDDEKKLAVIFLGMRELMNSPRFIPSKQLIKSSFPTELNKLSKGKEMSENISSKAQSSAKTVSKSASKTANKTVKLFGKSISTKALAIILASGIAAISAIGVGAFLINRDEVTPVVEVNVVEVNVVEENDVEEVVIEDLIYTHQDLPGFEIPYDSSWELTVSEVPSPVTADAKNIDITLEKEGVELKYTVRAIGGTGFYGKCSTFEEVVDLAHLEDGLSRIAYEEDSYAYKNDLFSRERDFERMQEIFINELTDKSGTLEETIACGDTAPTDITQTVYDSPAAFEGKLIGLVNVTVEKSTEEFNQEVLLEADQIVQSTVFGPEVDETEEVVTQDFIEFNYNYEGRDYLLTMDNPLGLAYEIGVNEIHGDTLIITISPEVTLEIYLNLQVDPSAPGTVYGDTIIHVEDDIYRNRYFGDHYLVDKGPDCNIEGQVPCVGLFFKSGTSGTLNGYVRYDQVPSESILEIADDLIRSYKIESLSGPDVQVDAQNPTTGWLTYTDTELFNIEFMYPSYLMVDTQTTALGKKLTLYKEIEVGENTKRFNVLAVTDYPLRNTYTPEDKEPALPTNPRIVYGGVEYLTEMYVAAEGFMGGSNFFGNYLAEVSEDLYLSIEFSGEKLESICFEVPPANPGICLGEYCSELPDCSSFVSEVIYEHGTIPFDEENAQLIFDSMINL